MIYWGSETTLFFYRYNKTMDITIYSAEGCTWCARTKELFARANVEYTEITINDENRDEFRRNYPNASSYPHVIIDGEEIGGLVPVAKLFLQKGLVSAPQK